MDIPYNLLKVRINVQAICDNYQRLEALADQTGSLVAVVKSNAYGHGLRYVAAALEKAGCRRMAVGTVAEAVHLRECGFGGQVVVLLGIQDAREAQACVAHDLLPFAAGWEHLERLAEAAARERSPVPICLKFDTGMRRLGFGPADLPSLLDRLRDLPELRVAMAASHLATADVPEEEAFVHKQGREFAAICKTLAAAVPPFERCLANSAAILAYPGLRLDVQRPGIALYGANPFHGTDWQEQGVGLVQAMEVRAPVLQVRDLAPGDTVSYGRTFKATESMRIAIVAAGYADCYSRGLSSSKGRDAAMLLHGQRAPIVGRVCMQMTAVDVTRIPRVSPGDEAFLLGGAGEQTIRAEELATWWGTIAYEVFCVLGLNPKEYT